MKTSKQGENEQIPVFLAIIIILVEGYCTFLCVKYAFFFN